MSRLSGYLAILLTMAIWSALLVTARGAVTTSLGPVELGLIRFSVALLLFMPFWLNYGPVPSGVSLWHFLVITICGGCGLFLLMMVGLRFAPVADAGVFAPSMLPLFGAFLAFLMLGERFERMRKIGIVLTILGALLIGGFEALLNSADGAWRGHLIFLGVAFVWSFFTVTFRMSGLAPIAAAGMMTFWSFCIMIGVAAWFGFDFTRASTEELLIQIVVQGVFAGFVATFTYAFAVSRIGPSATAGFGALVPVGAALGGLYYLGEPVEAFKWAGVAVTALGVLFASGALERQRPASASDKD